MLSVEAYLAMPAQPADARLAYGDDPQQFGDLYLPAGAGPHPVIILIHGGCWRAQYNLEPLGLLAEALRHEGFAVWSIEYRRIGNGGGWPTTFTDVAAAADALRSMAALFALDLTRVIAAGHSAGGHLALWLAARRHLAAQSPLAIPDPQPIIGVLGLAALADLRSAAQLNLCPGAIPALIGGSPEDVPLRYGDASPAAHFPLGVPHCHLVGEHDPIVPPSYLSAALATARDEAHLITLPDAGHFEVVDPRCAAWDAVRQALSGLLNRALVVA